jgi:hypothetical protein
MITPKNQRKNVLRDYSKKQECIIEKLNFGCRDKFNDKKLRR